MPCAMLMRMGVALMGARLGYYQLQVHSSVLQKQSICKVWFKTYRRLQLVPSLRLYQK